MIRKSTIVVLVVLLIMVFLGTGVFAAEYRMKSAEIFREGFTHSDCQKFFAKRVGEITNGKAEVKVFLGAVLGNERNYCEQLQMGSLHFGKAAASNAVAFVPEFAVFAMPYLIKDLDHLYRIFDSPAGDMIQKAANKAGLIVLAYWDMNTQSIYNIRGPIQKPADLRGLKIRTRQNPICIDTINALGASAAPLAMPELYTALQTGVFDGGDHDPTVFDAFNLGEVCKYYSLTEHTIEPCLFMASKKLFDKLPKDIQEAVIQAGKESMKECRRIGPIKTKAALERIKNEYGVKINGVDTAAFKELLKPVQEKYRKQLGPELVDEIAKLAK